MTVVVVGTEITDTTMDGIRLLLLGSKVVQVALKTSAPLLQNVEYGMHW